MNPNAIVTTAVVFVVLALALVAGGIMYASYTLLPE